MGYVLASGFCLLCKQTFAFNPMRVPSLRINGVREPICEACMISVNKMRASVGVAALAILPGAYEACDERELDDPTFREGDEG